MTGAPNSSVSWPPVLALPKGATIAYTTETVLLIHGDAREIVSLLPQVDLLVTDPPYGAKWDSGRHRTDTFGVMQGDEDQSVARDVLSLAIPKVRRGRHIYVFGPFLFDDLPVCGVAELVWDKGIIGLGDLQSPWGLSHERIAFGVYELSAANRAKGSGNLAARLRRGTVLRYQRPHSGQVRHPSEKPVSLLRELIESSSCMNEVVLDPFSGSGSTLVAAMMEGRRAIGVEVDERWIPVTIERLQRCRPAVEEYQPLLGSAAQAVLL